MKPKKEKNTPAPQGGRPSKYSKEIAEKICYLVETQAKGLNTICDENAELPSFRTVFYWLTKYPEFLQLYTRAREGQADTIADKMLEIAFRPSANLTEAQDKKTQLDTLKWIASKLKPRKYGDKLDLTSGGEKLAPIIFDLDGSHGNKPDTQTAGGAPGTEQ